MNFQQMHKQRKVTLIGGGVGFISCLLPWYSFGFGSINGLHSWGLLVFIFFGVSAALSCLGDTQKNLPGNFWLIILVSGIINLGITAYFIVRYLSATRGISKDDIPGLGSFGISFGIWIAVIAAIVMVAGAWLYRSSSDNIKSSFNSLKSDLQKTMADAGKANVNNGSSQ